MKRPAVPAFAIGLTALVGALSASSDKAEAVTVSGGISFEGVFELNGGLGDATAFTSFSNVEVSSVSGDYAGVPLGAPVSYAPQAGDPDGGFVFNPFTPVSPLWTFALPGPTEYSFDLVSLTILHQSPFALVLEGTGVARIGGFEDTVGSWTFMNNGFGPTVFRFVDNSGASGMAAPVPVPDGGSTLVLLGLVLLGTETLVRKARTSRRLNVR